MQSRWSETDAANFLEEYGPDWGEDLALRTYSSRLLGEDTQLVLYGGGNTSVKTTVKNIFGEGVPAIFVKASGCDLTGIMPDGHAGLRLECLLKLRRLLECSDDAMVNELRACLLDWRSPTPSIETLVHAFLPQKFIDHTHSDAILALTNQPDGLERAQNALGPQILVLDYVMPGFELARKAAEAYEKRPASRGMVWAKHGLVTWGNDARESYESTVEFVSKAEQAASASARRPLVVVAATPLETAQARWRHIAPVLRGLLAEPSSEADFPYRRVILQPLITREALDFVDSERGKQLALTPPLTSDHLIRTKALPLWIDRGDYDNTEKLRTRLSEGVSEYRRTYEEYLARHSDGMPRGLTPFEASPRIVLMPGVGAIAAGPDAAAARIARDITAHTIAVKSTIGAIGDYEGLPEEKLFTMEYRSFQHAKLRRDSERPLARQVGLVTGAAGALGSAIVEALLREGCHVAATDLPGERLDGLAARIRSQHASRFIAIGLDVTDPCSVKQGFESIAGEWGGVDLVVVNAGAAAVSGLSELGLEEFRKLERINVEGALLVLAEAERTFRLQGTGGDVVLVSTKNVFAPGARFGAYSATKAAAHQLARIASLEMAELGVRVNMVAPDAVFAHGDVKSGLWAEVGPDRMRARGLSAEGLEDYYRRRNLLKVKVTAEHVARAVLFFATRQTPTTGATLPVDGGLPDATPR